MYLPYKNVDFSRVQTNCRQQMNYLRNIKQDGRTVDANGLNQPETMTKGSNPVEWYFQICTKGNFLVTFLITVIFSLTK